MVLVIYYGTIRFFMILTFGRFKPTASTKGKKIPLFGLGMSFHLKIDKMTDLSCQQHLSPLVKSERQCFFVIQQATKKDNYKFHSGFEIIE